MTSNAPNNGDGFQPEEQTDETQSQPPALLSQGFTSSSTTRAEAITAAIKGVDAGRALPTYGGIGTSGDRDLATPLVDRPKNAAPSVQVCTNFTFSDRQSDAPVPIQNQRIAIQRSRVGATEKTELFMNGKKPCGCDSSNQDGAKNPDIVKSNLSPELGGPSTTDLESGGTGSHRDAAGEHV